MIEGLKPYSAYKDPGVQWLGPVPKHWHVRRLRNTADMRVSNVDKHTKDGEIPIRLCNYVDVYKNDRITDRVPFMRATASPNEIERFRIKVRDVLITKDSETWDDIGVPALVEYEADDLLCGYHLALLRPFEGVDGRFLFRALQCKPVAYQFHVEANGVTRFGLSHAAIKSVWLPMASVAEQAAIIRFLDHADRRILRYIRAKRSVIELLYEERQVIIHGTVTHGLDQTVRLKPSGVGWLGDVPVHWQVKRAKYLFREIDQRSTSGSEELLSVSHLTGVTPRSQKNVTMFKAASYVGQKTCQPGDLVINTMWAWMGALGVSRHPGIVSSAYGVYRPHKNSDLTGEYADLLLRTRDYVSEYTRRSTGIRSSRLRLYPEQFLRIPLCVPPIDEQRQIVSSILSETKQLSETIASTEREISLLHEYRTRLIADVVTGKLDVRAAAAHLPDDKGELDVGPAEETDVIQEEEAAVAETANG